MTGTMSADGDRPVGRVRFMDDQRVNLDGFAREEPGLGLVALRSPHDPEPGLVISGAV
jgi:propanediol dehydratase large subunit